MEPGIFLALIAAIFSSLKGAVRKHVSQDFSSVEIGLFTQIYGIILLMPLAIYRYHTNGINMDPKLGVVLTIATLTVLASSYLYVEALRITDISVTEPLRNTTPIFVALIEPLILAINFDVIIMASALLGTIGAYILVSKDSILTPIQNMKNKGALLAIIVAFLLSIYSITAKYGATNMDPILFGYITYILGFVGFWFWKKREGGSIKRRDYVRKDIIALGAVTAIGVIAGYFAYSMISASEVTIIGQTSAIFSVLIGGHLFKEENIVRKMIGAIIIVSGVGLVVI